MAGVAIRVDAARLRRKLMRAAKHAEHMQQAWSDVGEVLLRSIRRNFADGGRPGKWPPSRRGAAGNSKRRKGKRGGKTLIDTGRLLNSITYRATSRFVDVGTNVIYAATHQFGRGAIPARPFIMINDDDREPINKIMARWILGPLL